MAVNRGGFSWEKPVFQLQKYLQMVQEYFARLDAVYRGSHMAVEYAHEIEDDMENWRQSGDGLLILFGLHDDKIALFTEYWE